MNVLSQAVRFFIPFTWPGSSLAELGDRVREARHLPARIVLVNDVALRGLHQFRLGALHRFQRCVAITALDRFLDGADGTTHLSAARLVDDGAAGNLAGRLLGGSGIGHVLNYPSAVIARVVGLERAGRLNCVIAGLRFPGCSDVAVLEDAMDGSQNAPASGAAQRTAAAGLRPPPVGVL